MCVRFRSSGGPSAWHRQNSTGIVGNSEPESQPLCKERPRRLMCCVRNRKTCRLARFTGETMAIAVAPRERLERER